MQVVAGNFPVLSPPFAAEQLSSYASGYELKGSSHLGFDPLMDVQTKQPIPCTSEITDQTRMVHNHLQFCIYCNYSAW